MGRDGRSLAERNEAYAPPVTRTPIVTGVTIERDGVTVPHACVTRDVTLPACGCRDGATLVRSGVTVDRDGSVTVRVDVASRVTVLDPLGEGVTFGRPAGVTAAVRRYGRDGGRDALRDARRTAVTFAYGWEVEADGSESVDTIWIETGGETPGGRLKRIKAGETPREPVPSWNFAAERNGICFAIIYAGGEWRNGKWAGSYLRNAFTVIPGRGLKWHATLKSMTAELESANA
jgi:hypothetical protein